MGDSEQTIAYQVTRADLFAFGLSRAWRSRTARLLHGVAMIGLAAVGVHEASTRVRPLAMVIIAALVLPGFYVVVQCLLIPPYIWFTYGEGKNRGIVGSHRLTLRDDALHCESPLSSGQLKYGVIERIEQRRKHVFLFVSATSAIVIPKTRVSEGNLETFVSELKRRIAPSVT